MHTSKLNILKTVALFLIIVSSLTACTGREDIALELEGHGKVQGADIPVGDISASKDDENTQKPEMQTETQAEQTAVQVPDPPAVIYVHICGAVANPGVYELEAGSRVFEGIEAAGGFSEDACEDYVNQAKALQDGQRLVIPTQEEIEAAKEDGAYQESWTVAAADMEQSVAAGVTSSENTDGLININTASESELSTIDGIGAGKAAAIVKYRQENGAFQSIQDIMKVSGIKEGTYEKIKDKITVKQ